MPVWSIPPCRSIHGISPKVNTEAFIGTACTHQSKQFEGHPCILLRLSVQLPRVHTVAREEGVPCKLLFSSPFQTGLIGEDKVTERNGMNTVDLFRSL